MLTKEEFQQVVPELADYLSNQGDVRTLITVWFAPDHSPILQELPTNLSRVGEQALWLLQYCLVSRWSRNPSLMERLVARLVAQGGKGAFAPLRDRVHNQIDPNPNLFQTQWVLATQPFFDRAGLRNSAELLVGRSTQPILRVNGPVGSGKSYTAELLAYVADQGAGDLHIAGATVEADNGPSYEAAELAETLTLPMTPDDKIPERSTSSYPAALCRWIIRSALRRMGVWVLVLDGFGQKDVQPEVRELVQNLAKQVLAPEIAKRVRLVLIDSGEDVLTGNWRAKTLDDNLLSASTLTDADLIPCLMEHSARMRDEGKPWKAIDPAEVPTLAAALISRAPADPCKRLKAIYEDLLGIAQLGKT